MFVVRRIPGCSDTVRMYVVAALLGAAAERSKLREEVRPPIGLFLGLGFTRGGGFCLVVFVREFSRPILDFVREFSRPRLDSDELESEDRVRVLELWFCSTGEAVERPLVECDKELLRDEAVLICGGSS